MNPHRKTHGMLVVLLQYKVTLSKENLFLEIPQLPFQGKYCLISLEIYNYLLVW